MTVEPELGELGSRYHVKTFTLAEDGPGAYSLMAIRLYGDGNRSLERVGYGSLHTLVGKIDSGRKGFYHDPLVMLREDNFTAPGSVIDDFLKELMWNDELFEEIRDGEKYDHSEMEEMLDGNRR